MLSPATILMGGTLPVLGQLLVRTRSELATTTSLLLAINTLGATCGALAAGFWMPAALGLRASNGLAMVANLVVAAGALALRGQRTARTRSPRHAPDTAPSTTTSAATTAAPIATGVHVLAACSGFAVLALEVLWTRMFALVLNNSTYSFATILVVLLLALACGSLLAHEICRRTATPETAFLATLLCCGASVGITPFVLWWASDGLGDLRTDGGFASYVRAVIGQVAGGHSTWLAGGDLAALYARLTEGTPPERDPYLSGLEPEQVGFVRAGEILYRALVALDEGDKSRARMLRDEFRERVPYGTYEIFARRLARADD